MRPIDADKLKNSYGWWEGNDRHLTRDEVRHYFDAMIDAQATVEAEPVKHGRWIKSEKSDYNWECSNCGYGLTDYRTTYCYDCGAKMDLDEVEE